MTVYYIVLYPAPGYFRHFIVQEETPVAAVNKLNYQARQQLKSLRKQYPADPYGHVQQAEEVVATTRRYRRKYKPTFGHCESKACKIFELPMQQCWSGQLELGIMRNVNAWNILPEIPLSGAQDSRNVG